MCGVAGLFNAGADFPSVEEAGRVVAQITRTLAHRGPDAEGIWSDPQNRCHLGHRRLSIIDTTDAGRQPMCIDGGRWVISFNGELYNFLDLRRLLESKGIRFAGRTDTEVLLHAIGHWGVDALRKLDGMFALAAFDMQSGELILARDPFGEKPLYFMELPRGGLAFASELQALESIPGFCGEVSLDAMGELLMFQYIGAPRTIYRTVRKLAPGHWMRARAGRPLEIGRYFEFRPGMKGFADRPLPDLVDELEDILTRSVKRRLMSDVPLGAFLSGGVDSSTTCALVRRKLGLPLKTFSIGFEGAPESEHEAARLFARHLDTEHYDQILEPSAGEFLLDIGSLLDEPNGDSSCMPTYLLSRFSRQFVTVALSGDGGDEMFAGYDRYFSVLGEQDHALLRRLPGRNAGTAYYSGRILVCVDRQLERLFGFVPEGLATHLARLRREVASGDSPLICRLRRTDVENYMPGAVLAKVDRMSMQHALEVRTPFLNVELARFAERLPPSVLCTSGRGKILLRELAYRYLPRELIDAPKKGFGIPMSRWARESLLAVGSRLLESGDSRLTASLGKRAIERFMRTQRSPGGFSAYQIWSMAVLESWCRYHPAQLPDVRQCEPRRNLRAAFTTPPSAARESLTESLDSGKKPLRASRPHSKLYRYANVLLVCTYLALVGVWLLAAGRIPRPRLPTLWRYVFHKLVPGKLATLLSLGGGPWVDPARALERSLVAAIKQASYAREMPFSLRAGDRVVVLTHALVPGGAERQWCYLAAGLKAEGYSVTFVVTDGLEGSNGHYLPLLVGRGIEVVDLLTLKGRWETELEAQGPRRARTQPFPVASPFGRQLDLLVELLTSLQPRAVFAQLDSPNILGASSAILAGIPRAVMSFRNFNPSHFSYLRNNWFLPLYRTLCTAPRVRLAGNARLANEDYAAWIGVPPERIHWIPNAIDPANFARPDEASTDVLRQMLRLDVDAPVILGVFRLSEEKQPLVFLEVCARVARAQPNVRILVAGEGPMYAHMVKHLRHLGLEENVMLLGRRTDVATLMSLADLLLLTSALEGMSNVSLEAQLLALPVVATCAGEITSIVEDRVTGFVTPIGDVEALAGCCLTILENPGLAQRMGTRARQRVLEHFSARRLAQEHVAVLE